MSILYKTYFHGGTTKKNTIVFKKRIPDALYKKIHKTMIVVCVDLVVKHGKEFLLVKRKNDPLKGEWFLPGGRVYKGEGLRAAALRKLKEEVGLRGRVRKLLGAGEQFVKDGYYPKVSAHVVSFIFLVDTKSKKSVQLDSQSEAFAWFKKIPAKLHPYVKDFLREAGF